MENTNESFFELLERIRDFGMIGSPDLVAYVLPLFEQVNRLHENRAVAFINSPNKIQFEGQHLAFTDQGREFLKGEGTLFVKRKLSKVFETEEISQRTDLGVNTIDNELMEMKEGEEGKALERPIYLTNYGPWDLRQGHYDPLTDIFTLGLYTASVAFGLDFRTKDDLEIFVANRKRLYFLNKRLHPTILSVISEMTELYREDRTANLTEVITKLKNYREYNPENYADLTQTEGFRNQDVSERDSWILDRLKRRLFDISRRNKLLYFTDRKSFLNLTISSVPLLLDYKNIQENDLIFWNDNIKKKLISGGKLPLNPYLDFAQNRFLAPSINKIRLEATKSTNEYGFSQLRLVIAFLHWYNFKEDANERISTPLLLMPAEITRKKGVQDQYTLVVSDTEAEMNPVLSYYLKDLYDITLPDFVDLEASSIESLISSIESQIAAGSSGIKLEWRKQPKIQLIHTVAQKNFNLSNRKLVNRTSGLNLRSFDYSYDQENFQPLGLQIFNERIRSRNNALEYIINEDLKPIDNYAASEKMRTMYSADNDGEVNPLIWEVDTCNMTIGNFNYRKMSLVRDYNEIINSHLKDEIFAQLFSDSPKKTFTVSDADPRLAENFPIIASDPTQTSAVQHARTGDSYIIQGPPGTGKSQTITNLIADYIARDKKILFVCEKRAALDVVYHRLKNRNLDELCCLIHDSQTDKKSFIKDLGETYRDFLDRSLDQTSIEMKRDRVIDAIQNELNKLSYYHSVMQQGDTPPLQLFEVLHATKEGRSFPSENELIYLPMYAEWTANKDWLNEWFGQLRINGFGSHICDYPLARLSQDVLNESNVKAAILELVNASTEQLDEFIEQLDDLNEPNAENVPFSEWDEQFELISRTKGIVETIGLDLLRPKSEESTQLFEVEKQLEQQTHRHFELLEENKNWNKKLSLADAESALNQWNAFNQSILRFFKPSFYRLKGQIAEAYNFAAHSIRPTETNVLEKLLEEHRTEKGLQKLKDEARNKFGLTDFDTDLEWIKQQHKKPSKYLKVWLSNDSSERIEALQNMAELYAEFTSNTKKLFTEIADLTPSSLDERLGLAKSAIGSFSAFAEFVNRVHGLSREMKLVVYTKPWTVNDFEFNLAYRSLTDIYERERQFADMDESTMRISISRIGALLDEYYNSNVDAIRARIRAQFLDKVRITESTAAQLTPDEKLDKKIYNSGRRILDNEFGKSMRYKSIRELSLSDANSIMTSLKPVWLMSPLSVSDTMPIDPTLFDVVIYDEASQITVEEGVPSLFRTEQTIIVGDEMQMPPTNFFSTVSNQDEDEEEAEDRIGITLDAESLLNQGARKLPSVMLGWHYRSRHESLISFSNAAFYKRSLLTIPDSVVPNVKTSGIPPIVNVDEEVSADNILNRSISFHYLENAVYDKRANKDEATYIAKIVADLLKKKVGKSIGIVAFSMQQQSEIEEALDCLAASDPEFDTLLEEEFQRVDEDQFNGLFVKNLENVQGDERDIIIMSVCYGHNATGKMLMNFGPINRRGGEKRLNVIFSRAKLHMVVVSSILPNEIKNDYNEGANYFKRFLTYAKHVSDGSYRDADLVLDGLHNHQEHHTATTNNIVVNQLKNEIEKLGYQADVAIGQSHFKCDVGIKKSDADRYELGILIDKPLHYANPNVLEQYCQKPEILNAFGWNVTTVYSKDWFEKPDAVIQRIKYQLEAGAESKDVDITELIAFNETEAETTAIIPDAELPESPVISAETQEEPENQPQESRKEEKPEIKTPEHFQRFEFSEGSSNKFWQITVEGTSVVVEYGRIGNRAQSNVKTFDTEQKAQHEMQSMISKKVSKGYKKVDN